MNEHAVVKTAESVYHGVDRFGFGANWRRFLDHLSEDRIAWAEHSLLTMLEVPSLEGSRFLDAGCGSGLFSLAARRLGASVVSFDYDPDSVACTQYLRERFFPADTRWVVEQGSALDAPFVESLGLFDVVYSWGVLHHTGSLWKALDLVSARTQPGGLLFIGLYNDVGSRSRRWVVIKRWYNRIPRVLRAPYVVLTMAPSEMKVVLRALATLNVSGYVREWTTYSRRRGMDKWHDWVDWVGGYPYEASTPEQVFDFCRARGFVLTRLQCGNVGLGINQFVFRRAP